MIGKTLGHYEILEPLGAGGMGEVYRAHDASLKRDVAIKVLPEVLADDPERLARLEREAHLLAALNHSNIATIYSLEEADGTRFLVMELVKGESLEQLIAAGPLPVEKALGICEQIARALEAAHAEGIIHRDLKPANVLITPDGHAKVLDFGLAKAAAADSTDADLSRSPTVTVAGTRTGVILGTAPYMSPEQVRGKQLDKRTDIWAFGCLLYETLTGKRAFDRETVADTLAAVLDAQPDWEILPAVTPAIIVALLHRCLRKDPDRRLHDVADARIEIEEVTSQPEGESEPAEATSGSRAPKWFQALAAVAVAWAASATFLAIRNPEPTVPAAQPQYFQISVPPGTEFVSGGAPAISPDGTRFAYAARLEGESVADQRLFLQSLDRQQPWPVADSEGAFSPFFSPDGDWIGFFAGRELRKVSFLGGSATPVARIPTGVVPASWGADDKIYFAVEGTGIHSVSASGGDQEVVVAPDAKAGEWDLLHPHVLPGGRALLIDVSYGGRIDDEPIVVYDLDTQQKTLLVEQGSMPKYTESGHVVFGRRGQLLAIPFDLERLDATGPAVPVLDGVLTNTLLSRVNFDLSRSGAVIYRAGTDQVSNLSLLMVDREKNEQVLADRGTFWVPRFSPEGDRIAVGTLEGDIQIVDLRRGGPPERFTTQTVNWQPIWAPGGDRIAFTSTRDGVRGVYWKSTTVGSSTEALWHADVAAFPISFSPSGDLLAVEVSRAQTGYDIGIVHLREDEPRLEDYLRTEDYESSPKFSPDGSWIAYVSSSSGQNEVYVAPYPPTGARYPVSRGGRDAAAGYEHVSPAWSGDGTELFYRETGTGRVMVVEVETEPEFRVSDPVEVFQGQYTCLGSPCFDVSADGQYFAMLRSNSSAPQRYLQVILDWSEELSRLAPTGR